MSNKNLTIDLKTRIDCDGKRFHVGKLRCPVSIDCSKGVVFLVFTSDQGDEQIQVAPMDNKDREERDED